MTANKHTKNVLIAPLNWGLGHASRCIPIVEYLLAHHYNPIIASDGAALELLKQEFPQLTFVNLPSYHITYAKNAFFFKWKLLWNFFTVLKAVKAEKKIIAQIVADKNIYRIISDNRFGVYHKNIPSVFITHQLQVFSGVFTSFTTKIHQKIIANFDECWIPDDEKLNLSGFLSKDQKLSIPLKYLGVLSRFEKLETEKKYTIAIVLSGPEPQRSILEEKIRTAFSNYKGKAILVRGVLTQETMVNHPVLEVVNFMNSKTLNLLLNSTELVVARSGYTTVLDLAKIGGKAFFIPTPGQDEQQYLAKYLQTKKIAPFCKQDEFDLDKLMCASEFKGFSTVENKQLEMVLKKFLDT